jgi:hypothetical protein
MEKAAGSSPPKPDSDIFSHPPLKLFLPLNATYFLSFYSPIIVATSITSLSFMFQNFKGLIYLGYLIGCCLLRNYVYMISGAKTTSDENNGTDSICTSVQYSKYGNMSFSSFVFAFTIMYLSFPMFTSGSPNFWVFSSLLVYFFVDIFIKIYNGCVVKYGDLLLNILLGLASSALIITLMYAGGSSKYLFFNEISSNKEMCSQPKNQTFKCAVYKNGELVGSV